jgi:hypothetical protein
LRGFYNYRNRIGELKAINLSDFITRVHLISVSSKSTFIRRMDFAHVRQIAILFYLTTVNASFSVEAQSQQKSIDGKEFSPYRPSAFRPKRGLFYTIYVSPVYTVDPLGLGGKSAYALSLAARINVWESKSPEVKGLKIIGWYIGGGYEFYPQQFDLIYFSSWMRVKTFLPLVGKIDNMYADDGTHRGIMTRYCLGVEVKKLSIMLSGTTSRLIRGEAHPASYSEYTNAGSIIVIIPIYTRD